MAVYDDMTLFYYLLLYLFICARIKSNMKFDRWWKGVDTYNLFDLDFLPIHHSRHNCNQWLTILTDESVLTIDVKLRQARMAYLVARRPEPGI